MKADELDTQEREPIAQAAKGKGFFALDVDQFFRIQSEGFGIEEAATYLALMLWRRARRRERGGG